jgi:single-stranded-DNA-specific exonuclease
MNARKPAQDHCGILFFRGKINDNRDEQAAEMNWEKKDAPADLVKEIAAKYGCTPLVASILVRRGILEGENILYFLESERRHLHNPFEMPGMEDAVERILAARDEGEKVLVFGDRDVDGITSAALLVEFLKKTEMDVDYRIPTGDEPYGLSMEAVDTFAAASGTLIITVDCGISNVKEIAHAATLGIDVVVTDHHNPQEALPEALAIVNPKLKGGSVVYPFTELAGCGVAYKLVSALRFALKSELYGQPVCLLNTYPANEAYIIEIIKTKNLAITGRLVETVVPGMVKVGETRLPAFLEGQQIFTWDESLQKKTLAKIFGNNVEINMLDIAPEIAKEIPATAGKSLLRLREMSKIARYSAANAANGVAINGATSFSEIDVFHNLFVSFVQKRERYHADEDSSYIQLAAIGTVADLMPILDENRIIVRDGLKALSEKARPGLSDLLFKLDLAGKEIGTVDIAWRLAPAINSAGRMGHPEKPIALFFEEDRKARNALASEIVEMNSERKKLGAKIWLAAEPQAAANLADYGGNLAVASGEDIPRGLTGIIANDLVKRFKIPACVVSVSGQLGTGSLRSARGYDLTGLLDQCADLFIDRGGHDYAAGFSIDMEKWPVFLERLQSAAQTIELGSEADNNTISIDAELPLAYMNPDIFSVVDRFEPYGKGNDTLTFLCRGLKITDIKLMGKQEEKHVKLTLNAGAHSWPAVYWSAVEKIKTEFDLNDTVDAVFKITRNYFNGTVTPQLIISDIKRSA